MQKPCKPEAKHTTHEQRQTQRKNQESAQKRKHNAQHMQILQEIAQFWGLEASEYPREPK